MCSSDLGGQGSGRVPDGAGLLNYRQMNNVAVVLGDPVCAPEAITVATQPVATLTRSLSVASQAAVRKAPFVFILLDCA